VSEAVELDQLLEVAGRFGTAPMLLTTDADGRPRAAAVTLEWDDEGDTAAAGAGAGAGSDSGSGGSAAAAGAGRIAHVRAGNRSLTNAAARPLVALLWPAPPGERFALLVDAEVVATTSDDVPAGAEPGSRAARVGGWVDVRPTNGILHVVAGHR
jgi:hypothetical protein